jgi:hypothetical protein
MIELDVIKNIENQDFFKKSKKIKSKIKNIREISFIYERKNKFISVFFEFLLILPIFILIFLYLLFTTPTIFNDKPFTLSIAILILLFFTFVSFSFVYLYVCFSKFVLKSLLFISGDWFLYRYYNIVSEYDKNNFTKCKRKAFKTGNYQILLDKYGYIDFDEKNTSYNIIDSINVIQFINQSNKHEKEFLQKYSHLDLNNTSYVTYSLLVDWINTNSSYTVLKNRNEINNIAKNKLLEEQFHLILDKINEIRSIHRTKNIKNF